MQFGIEITGTSKKEKKKERKEGEEKQSDRQTYERQSLLVTAEANGVRVLEEYKDEGKSNARFAAAIQRQIRKVWIVDSLLLAPSQCKLTVVVPVWWWWWC